jgi:effector-binding domain-containing protein
MRDHEELNESQAEDLMQRSAPRRSFLKSAAGGLTAISALGLAPLLRGKSAAVDSQSNLATPGVVAASSLAQITHYVSISHTGPFQDVNNTWARLTQFVLHNNLSSPGVIAFAAACPCGGEVEAGSIVGADGSTELQYQACIAVSPSQHAVVSRQLAANPSLNYAGVKTGTASLGSTKVVVHRGSYSTIGDTYRNALNAGVTLFSSQKQNGQPFSIEVYKNNPLLTKPEDLITEIHFPASSSYSATGPLFE